MLPFSRLCQSAPDGAQDRNSEIILGLQLTDEEMKKKKSLTFTIGPADMNPGNYYEW